MSVKLRQKKMSAGKISLYLDIYHNGQRQYDFLKLQLLKGTDSRIKAMNRKRLNLPKQLEQIGKPNYSILSMILYRRSSEMLILWNTSKN